eukprot:scaffold33229_cov112-Isochrysis_galbana.AAC.7
MPMRYEICAKAILLWLWGLASSQLPTLQHFNTLSPTTHHSLNELSAVCRKCACRNSAERARGGQQWRPVPAQRTAGTDLNTGQSSGSRHGK